MFTPQKILSWWSSKPWYVRVLLAVPVFALCVLAILGGMAVSKRLVEPSASDSAEEAKAREVFYKNQMDKTLVQDKNLSKLIAEEKIKRDTLRERQRKADAERKKEHEAINDAKSIADVNDVLRKARRIRRSKPK